MRGMAQRKVKYEMTMAEVQHLSSLNLLTDEATIEKSGAAIKFFC
jgi:hypothetical protein